MAGRPRIGVTGHGKRWSPGWWCTAMALRWAGATPERLSVRHPPSGAPLGGLVIGGGDDISPEHYGGDLSARVRADPERDRLEIDWINRALEAGWPLLGICRGAQLINVVLGGSLHPDIRHLRHHTRNRPGLLATKHVAVVADSQLARICGVNALKVNSLHHQAVSVPGRGLRVVGADRDDIVQAVEADDERAIVGVQWHPEYLAYLSDHRALFHWLVGAAR